MVTYNAYSELNDYYIGLKAFRDGFYDYAAENLEEYLKGELEEEKKLYAMYMLYLSYFNDGDLEKAFYYLDNVYGKQDSRFDRSSMKKNKMHIYTKNNYCELAKQFLIKEYDDINALQYIYSTCPIDTEVIDSLKGNEVSKNIKMTTIEKLKANPDIVLDIFDSMNFKELSDKERQYFGIYFFKNNNFDAFWKIYHKYRDNELVNLALERLWMIGELSNFAKSFEYNEKKYSIYPTNYCRITKIYKESGKPYDCDLIDYCFNEKHDDFYLLKTGCYLKNGNKNQIVAYLESIPEAKVNNICVYAKYIIAKHFYNTIILDMLKSCKEKYDIAEMLVAMEKPDDIIRLMGSYETDYDFYYMAIANIIKNNMTLAEKYKNKIKDVELERKLDAMITKNE